MTVSSLRRYRDLHKSLVIAAVAAIQTAGNGWQGALSFWMRPWQVPALRQAQGEREFCGGRTHLGISMASLIAASIAVEAALIACSVEDTPAAESVERVSETKQVDGDLTAGSSENVLSEPEQTWTVATESSELDAILATPDLAPGTRRFAVVLTDGSGIVSLPIVQLAAYRYPEGFDASEGREGPLDEQRARFYPFPLGSRGLHAAELRFDEAGDWGVEARVPRPDGDVEFVEVRFSVADRTASIDLGQMPPSVPSRTLDDVADIADLTTGSSRYPDLYQISVTEAVNSGKPTVIVFASPAFCTNAVCGPQVEVLQSLSEAYGTKANFIHVDLYENPQEIQGDLTRAVHSPLLEAWGLVSQEWTFVLDEQGVVVGRFENFAPEPELDAVLKTVLRIDEN